MSRPSIALLILAGVAFALVPFTGSAFHLSQATRILIYAIFAMSLDLLVGYAGLVSLGHAAFFGVSAYTAALLADKLGIGNVLIGLPVSLLAAALASLVIGVLSLRASGVYFIMVTLAFAQIVYFIVHDNAYFGRSDGILVFARFEVRIGDHVLLNLGEPLERYVFAFVACAAVLYGLLRLVDSPFGRVIQGIRSNERRMRALGYPVERYKLACFVIGGTLAGLAGYLYFLLTGFVDPTLVDWLHSAQLLVIVLLGGLGTLIGPAFGAIALIIFIDQTSDVTEHWKLYLGVIVIIVTLYARGGILGVWNDLVAGLARLQPKKSEAVK